MSLHLVCDMDGVLVNMDQYIQQYLSAEAQEDKVIMWEELRLDHRFYRKMKPTNYARQLWKEILLIDPAAGILSALPRKDTIPYADKDKRHWVSAHRSSIFMGNEPEVETCLYSANKWKSCTGPLHVLIDDKPENCNDWETKGGGIAIHHNGNVTRTIKRLRALTQAAA